MTALSLYLAFAQSTNLASAKEIYNGSAGSPSTGQTATFCGTSLGFGEMLANGNTSSVWSGSASLPPQSGGGFLFDGAVLLNQTIPAGAWSWVVRFVCQQGVTLAGTLGADIWCRASKWNSQASTYTTIATGTLAAQTLTSTLTNYTVNGTQANAVSFLPNDFLYLDYFLNINTNANGTITQNVRFNRFSNDTVTFVGDAFTQITTPGYNNTVATNNIPTSLVPGYQNILRRRFAYAN